MRFEQPLKQRAHRIHLEHRKEGCVEFVDGGGRQRVIQRVCAQNQRLPGLSQGAVHRKTRTLHQPERPMHYADVLLLVPWMPTR